MVLMRNGRAEQGKNAIAGGLHDISAVSMDGIDHQLEGRIDNRTGFLRVEVLHQLHRTFDIGEQRGHRLTLTFEIFWVRRIGYPNRCII